MHFHPVDLLSWSQCRLNKVAGVNCTLRLKRSFAQMIRKHRHYCQANGLAASCPAEAEGTSTPLNCCSVCDKGAYMMADYDDREFASCLQ